MQTYKGESELEYYNLLSPDDGPELEECEGCGEMFDPEDLIDGSWCEDCYDWDDSDWDDEEDEDEE